MLGVEPRCEVETPCRVSRAVPRSLSAPKCPSGSPISLRSPRDRPSGSDHLPACPPRLHERPDRLARCLGQPPATPRVRLAK